MLVILVQSLFTAKYIDVVIFVTMNSKGRTVERKGGRAASGRKKVQVVSCPPGS